MSRTEGYLADRRRYAARMALIQRRQERPVTETVETPKEHNQPVPPPEAIITVQLSEMRRAQDEAASSNGVMRAAYAKAEAKGVNLAAAKRALKIQKSGKAEEFVAEMTELLRYLKIMGIGIQKSQLDLFDVATTLAPIDEKAREEGLLAGRWGKPADENPHDLSTPAGQSWLAAHYEGLEERRLVIAMQAAEESETEVIAGDDADGDQADIEDDEPFGGAWPDDQQIAARAGEA